MRVLEEVVKKSPSYRGKVLSLEAGEGYSGQGQGVKVHRLREVSREEVILPAATLALLERNVMGFVSRREKIGAMGQSRKKGLLFHGRPGTGKTHTIHYLARALAGHTTLIVTAEQVGLLPEYMTLARLLQPSMVVIEDADLIARERSRMASACEEVMLNRLLNEMDGLKEDADVIFVLTTNRPEALEEALTARPGRVDQAVEFPLPDEAGREKLVRLYAGKAAMTEEVVKETVERTEGVSAAFIKELMRRAVQFHLEREETGRIDGEDVRGAIEEMVVGGGAVNRRLMGVGQR
jgi:ATP-dependent 26S proteasome regulatory subunit